MNENSFDRQLVPLASIRRVTTEAARRLVMIDHSSCRLREIRRFHVARSHRQVEPIQRVVIADAALIKLAVQLKHVRLPRAAQPESPADRHSQGLVAV